MFFPVILKKFELLLHGLSTEVLLLLLLYFRMPLRSVQDELLANEGLRLMGVDPMVDAVVSIAARLEVDMDCCDEDEGNTVGNDLLNAAFVLLLSAKYLL